MSEAREWLIRKGGYFYQPNWCGYTTRKCEAGRYTKAEADREASVEPWHMKAIHQDEVPDDPVSADLRQELDRLQRENAELREAMEMIKALVSYIDATPRGERQVILGDFAHIADAALRRPA